LLGTAEAQRSIDSDGEAPTEHTRVENTIVEAVPAPRPNAVRPYTGPNP
jgi:hypothetical protein